VNTERIYGIQGFKHGFEKEADHMGLRTGLTRKFIRNQGMECWCFFFWMLWLASAIADRTDEADPGGRDGIHVEGTERVGGDAST
jgi:hypothetical protein